MTDFALPPARRPSLPVAGFDQRFAVRRIYCVGRNYGDHAREMGHDPNREPPFFFSKPADALLSDGADLPYPPKTADLNHEGELVVALGRGGRDIPLEEAAACVWGYAVGCDLTLRDLQAVAKKAGRPWDLSKGFDHSAVCGSVHPVVATGTLSTGSITLAVNGTERQRGDLSDMIWNVPEVISYLSGYIELKPGDLVYTGTPAGVGSLVVGDHVRIEIAGLAPLEFAVL